jgi:hypothetical protein
MSDLGKYWLCGIVFAFIWSSLHESNGCGAFVVIDDDDPLGSYPGFIKIVFS